MMKRYILWAALAAAALCTGCAKSPVSGINEANKAFLEAWVKVHHPDARKTSMGAYVIEETKGTGEALGTADDSPYVRVNFIYSDLDGNILDYNTEPLAKQLGTYEECNFYGPEIWVRADNGVPAGIEEALADMNIGGKKKVMIPGWLLTTTIYDTAQEYYDNETGTDAIYTIEPLEIIKDIVKWEVDSLCSYLGRNYPTKSPEDSLKYGYYYIRTGEPSDTCGFRKDTTIYINYIGRLLNGTVFDTSIADTAKFYGIYNPSTTYGPKSISCNETYSSIQMGSSSVIDGFAYTIYQMHSFEKGTGIFYSAYGYEYSGSGETIPPYSPLRFDIEVVKNE